MVWGMYMPGWYTVWVVMSLNHFSMPLIYGKLVHHHILSQTHIASHTCLLKWRRVCTSEFPHSGQRSLRLMHLRTDVPDSHTNNTHVHHTCRNTFSHRVFSMEAASFCVNYGEEQRYRGNCQSVSIIQQVLGHISYTWFLVFTPDCMIHL